jgi:hypothetical protein
MNLVIPIPVMDLHTVMSPFYTGWVFISGYDPMRRIEAIHCLMRERAMTVMGANAFLLKGDFRELDREFFEGRDKAQKWLETYTTCGFTGYISGFGQGHVYGAAEPITVG